MAKIIIVEDDAVIRTHMAEALRADGHQVVDCDGSADPAAFCSKEAADLLVMDIGLSHKMVSTGVNKFAEGHKSRF